MLIALIFFHILLPLTTIIVYRIICSLLTKLLIIRTRCCLMHNLKCNRQIYNNSSSYKMQCKVWSKINSSRMLLINRIWPTIKVPIQASYSKHCSIISIKINSKLIKFLKQTKMPCIKEIIRLFLKWWDNHLCTLKQIIKCHSIINWWIYHHKLLLKPTIISWLIYWTLPQY